MTTLLLRSALYLLGFDDVMHELYAQPSTQGDHFHGCLARLGEGGVEEAKAETILQISNGINKRWVSVEQ